jgi:hypothetical protein
MRKIFPLIKIYFLIQRYKSIKEREAYHNAMKVLLPMFLERIYRISDDASDLSVLTQKQILKIFFTFIQVIFNKIFNKMRFKMFSFFSLFYPLMF